MGSIVGKTLAVRFEPTYAIFVHSDQPPTDQEWDRAIEEYRTLVKPWTVSVLVYSEGGAPTATQRAKLIRVLGRTLPRVAMLTKSIVARMAAKAVGLFAKELRVFDTDQLDAAFAHLQLSERDRAGALRQLSELRTELSAEGGSVRLPKSAG